MYSLITNPNTGRKVNIYGRLGKAILRNYLSVLSGGASHQPAPDRMPPLAVDQLTERIRTLGANKNAAFGANDLAYRYLYHHVDYAVRQILTNYASTAGAAAAVAFVVVIIYDIIRTLIEMELRGAVVPGLTDGNWAQRTAGTAAQQAATGAPAVPYGIGSTIMWRIMRDPSKVGWTWNTPAGAANLLNLPDFIVQTLQVLNTRWNAGGGTAGNIVNLHLHEQLGVLLYTHPLDSYHIKFYEIINYWTRTQQLSQTDFGYYRSAIRDALRSTTTPMRGLQPLNLQTAKTGRSHIFRAGGPSRRTVWDTSKGTGFTGTGPGSPVVGDRVVFRSFMTSFTPKWSVGDSFLASGGIFYLVTPLPPHQTNLRWLNGEYSYFATTEAEAVLFADAAEFMVTNLHSPPVYGSMNYVNVQLVWLQEMVGTPTRVPQWGTLAARPSQ